MKDYYGILGLPPTASAWEIKKAYRQLAVRYHPDKNPSAEAKDLFQEINEAYDVLGDPPKRALYDQRRANPFAEILEEPIARHRDPAYRPRAGRPRRPSGPPASWLLMRQSLPYVMWISRVGLLLTSLFFLDYFLPYTRSEESIEQIYAVKLRRGTAYHVLVTGTGRRIKLYEGQVAPFLGKKRILCTFTPLFHTEMSVSNPAATEVIKLAFMYRHMIFLPALLFISSLMAILFRNRVEFSFNLNIAAFVLLIVNFFMM